MPKRPLSAYNLFFQHEREQLIIKANQEHEASLGTDDEKKIGAASSAEGTDTTAMQPTDDGSDSAEKLDKSKLRRPLTTSGIGFANLAKTIAAKWRNLDQESRSAFEAQAASEKARYQEEMLVWRSKKQAEKDEKAGADSEAKPDERSKSSPAAGEKRKNPPKENSSRRGGSESLSRKKAATGSSALSRSSRRSATNNVEASAFIDNDDTNFDAELSSEVSWADPNDGGSLASAHEDTLDLFDTDDGLDQPVVPVVVHSAEIRSCEELARDMASGESKTDSPTSAVVHSSLKALKSSLDENTVNFLTNLKFD